MYVYIMCIKIYLMWREFFSTGDTCGTSSNIVRVIAHLKQTALTQHDMCPGYAQVSGTDLISGCFAVIPLTGSLTGPEYHQHVKDANRPNQAELDMSSNNITSSVFHGVG